MILLQGEPSLAWEIDATSCWAVLSGGFGQDQAKEHQKENVSGPLLHTSTSELNTRSSKPVSLPSLRSWWGSVPWCPGKGEIRGLEFEHFLSAIYFFDTQSPRAGTEVVKPSLWQEDRVAQEMSVKESC